MQKQLQIILKARLTPEEVHNLTNLYYIYNNFYEFGGALQNTIVRA